MTRTLAFLIPFFAAAMSMSIFAGNELPKSDADDESFEIEPPLLIPNRDAEKPSAANADAPTPAPDLAKLEKDFERAKRNASGADRLFKIGAIAKVEAEQRALRVVRLQSDLENARLALAKEAQSQQQDPETEIALARAIESAHGAAAKRERAELDFAEANLHRQQKLLALGSGHRSDVSRAEQKLAELKAPKE